jgi:hypothetical protein
MSGQQIVPLDVTVMDAVKSGRQLRRTDVKDGNLLV